MVTQRINDMHLINPPDVDDTALRMYWGVYPDAPELSGMFWTYPAVEPRTLSNYVGPVERCPVCAGEGGRWRPDPVCGQDWYDCPACAPSANTADTETPL